VWLGDAPNAMGHPGGVDIEKFKFLIGIL